MKVYQDIVLHYETCLAKHGDTHLGVDWPKLEDTLKRHAVMLDVVRGDKCDFELLDLGCGASHFYEYLMQKRLAGIRYSGLDISEKFISLSQKKFPENTYFCLDVLTDGDLLPKFDYIVMNGVFTEKRSLSFGEMFDYFKSVVRIVFQKARIGIAVNVMSKQVAWEREDLFHLPLDILADFLVSELSRNFVIRNDYGLYEYTVYVYHHPFTEYIHG